MNPERISGTVIASVMPSRAQTDHRRAAWACVDGRSESEVAGMGQIIGSRTSIFPMKQRPDGVPCWWRWFLKRLLALSLALITSPALAQGQRLLQRDDY